MFKLPAMDDIEEVLVNESVVKNNGEPLIIHSRSKKTSAA
jgi:ATP-dependent protease Clp ATPase subunit